jgi:putative tricarboxylic transport membrane protein
VALLIPLTFHMDAASAVIMIAGIYYGTQYGGSTTSILVNIPGEAASVITCLDGHQMTRQGRAGAALGISAFASFIAGTIGVVALMLVAPPLAEFALKFGPPEIFALVFLAFTLVAFLSSGSMTRALMMVVTGLLLATVGQEAITAIPRFTFGNVNLQSGSIWSPDDGAFGVSEVLLSLENMKPGGWSGAADAQILGSLPDRQDWRRRPDRQRIGDRLSRRTTSGDGDHCVFHRMPSRSGLSIRGFGQGRSRVAGPRRQQRGGAGGLHPL